jgi:NADPH:quinone reductase-like Zn-dependent oxidoreductase
MHLPIPEHGPEQLLVRLEAASFNPFDLTLASGAMEGKIPTSFPLVYGQDGAGVVEAVGHRVTEWQAGARVYGSFMLPARGLGSYAEYGVVNHDGAVAAMPSTMIAEQAAAVPLVAATATRLAWKAEVGQGQVVLVVGATGGVGQATVQVAKLAGATVVATGRPEMAPILRKLGAATVVDHSSGSIVPHVRREFPDGVQAVLDVVNTRETVSDLADVLAPGGVLASTRGAADADALATRGYRGVNISARTTGELLESVAEMIDTGELTFRVQQRLSLEAAPQFLAAGGPQGSTGKTIIKI